MSSLTMAMSGQSPQGKTKSYSRMLHTKRALRGLVCVLFCLLSLLPFLLMIMNATRTSSAIQAGVSLIPSSHLLENWNMLLQKQNGMRLTLGRAMLNSLCITIPGTFLSVYCSCMTAISIGQTLSRLSPRATPCKQLSLHTAFHGKSSLLLV